MANTGQLSSAEQLQELWDAINKLSELAARQSEEIEDLQKRVEKLEAERLPTQPLKP